MKLGLPLGSHQTQHASYIIHEERLGNIFRELRTTGSHPGLNRGLLTLVVSTLPPELCIHVHNNHHRIPHELLCIIHCTCTCTCTCMCALSSANKVLSVHVHVTCVSGVKWLINLTNVTAYMYMYMYVYALL